MSTSEKLNAYALTTLQRVKDLLFDPSQSNNTTGDTTQNSTSIANVASVAGIKIGQAITGAGIPDGTTIAAVGTNTLTLSQAATATATGINIYVAAQPAAFDTLLIRLINGATDYIKSQTGDRDFLLTQHINEVYTVWGSRQKYVTLRQAPVFYLQTLLTTTLGSTAATLGSANSGIAVGMPIIGDGIPVNATVAAISGTSLTLSAPAVSSNTNGNVLIHGLVALQYRAGTPSTPNWTSFILDQYDLVDNGKAGLARVYGNLPQMYSNMVRATYWSGFLINFDYAGDPTKHTLPADLSRTCENIVVRWYKRRDQAGKTSEAFQGATISFNKEIDNEDLAVIGKYQRAPVIM